MSQNRKLLKVFSLIQFVLGIIALILGIVFAAGASMVGGDAESVTLFGTYLDAAAWSLLNGVILIALGILQIASSVLGIRGANRPSALKGHLPITVVIVIIACVDIFISANIDASTSPIGILAIALVGVGAGLYDQRTRQELDR